jgi:hypothetical protein
MGLFDEGGWTLEMLRSQYDHDTFDARIADAPDGSLPPVAHQDHLDLPGTPLGTRP